eukprot:746864-Hanusia_phi.AAC.6
MDVKVQSFVYESVAKRNFVNLNVQYVHGRTMICSERLRGRRRSAKKLASKGKVVRRGVKEVVKAVRKGEKGVCVIAGDISPIDVISHLPVLCEDKDVPYVFVPSKEALGTAGQTKRPTSCVLIKKPTDEEGKEKYDEIFKKVKGMQMY